MRRRIVPLLAALAVTVVVVVGGLALLGRSGDDAAPTGRASASPTPFSTTPLSAYDATTVTVARSSFCSKVDPRQVSAALGGGAATSQRTWNDGDRARLGGGPTDVSHEFGCEYVGAAGTTARAWVFAPPVRTSTATRLARQTEGTGTCTTAPAAFGSPSSLLTCKTTGRRSATYRGLFGDAWLTCEVDAPAATTPAAVTDRAGRWCVGVAQAAHAAG